MGWLRIVWLLAAPAVSSAAARIGGVTMRRRLASAAGQDIIEYAGMLAIIALIVAAILMLHLPSVIGNALDSAVKSITGSGHSSSSH